MSQVENNSLAGQKIIVTGGSRGLGLGISEALVALGAKITIVARDNDNLQKVSERLSVTTICGDVNENQFAEITLRKLRPDIVILNAGAVPPMGAIDKISWEDFTAVWNQDVKSHLHWIQAALRLPLASGSRMLLGSSGAAVAGSPLSGGYAGAKRMIWMMAGYANGISEQQNLGIKFQALVPRQLFANTRVGEAGARDYARRRKISADEIFAEFKDALTPRSYGNLVAKVLTNSEWKTKTVLGFSGAAGIKSLDGDQV